MPSDYAALRAAIEARRTTDAQETREAQRRRILARLARRPQAEPFAPVGSNAPYPDEVAAIAPTGPRPRSKPRMPPELVVARYRELEALAPEVEPMDLYRRVGMDVGYSPQRVSEIVRQAARAEQPSDDSRPTT